MRTNIRRVKSGSIDDRYTNDSNKVIIRLSNNILNILNRNPDLIEGFSDKLIEFAKSITKTITIDDNESLSIPELPYDKNLSWDIEYTDEEGKHHKTNKDLVFLMINPREGLIDTASIDYASRAPMDLQTTISTLTNIPDSGLDETFTEDLINKYSGIDDSNFTLDDSEKAWDLVKYNLNEACSSIIEDIASKIEDKDEDGSSNADEFLRKINSVEKLRDYIVKEVYSSDKGKAIYEFMINNFPLMLSGGDYINGLGKDLTKNIIYNFASSLVNEDKKNYIKYIFDTISSKEKKQKELNRFQRQETENIERVIRDLLNLRKLNDKWATAESNELISKYSLDSQSPSLKKNLRNAVNKDDIIKIGTDLLNQVYNPIKDDPEAVNNFMKIYANLLNSLNPFGAASIDVNVPAKDDTLMDLFDEEDTGEEDYKKQANKLLNKFSNKSSDKFKKNTEQIEETSELKEESNTPEQEDDSNE